MINYDELTYRSILVIAARFIPTMPLDERIARATAEYFDGHPDMTDARLTAIAHDTRRFFDAI